MKLTLPDWGVIGIIFVVSGWVAYAEVTHKKVRSIEELTKILGRRHVEEDAEAKGRKELLEKLCKEGKLKEEDCAEVDD